MGIRDIRLLGISVIDVLLTAITSYVIFPNNFWVAFFVLFVIGFILHLYFNVKTPLTKSFL
jgi:hypothetical protein